MKKSYLFLLTIVCAVILCGLTFEFGPTASSQRLTQRKGAEMKLEMPLKQGGLENFDIRGKQADTNTGDRGTIPTRRTESLVAAPKSDSRSMRAVAESFQARTPGLRVEFNDQVGVPEIVEMQGGGALAAALSAGEAKQGNEIALRRFLGEYAELYGLDPQQVDDQLVTVADYTNPAGNLSFVELEQRVNDVPVFQSYVRGIFSGDGRLVRTTGLLAPRVQGRLSSRSALSAADAVAAGARTINVNAEGLAVVEQDALGQKQVVDKGPFDENTKVEKIYFPIAPGRLALAYSMVLWQPDDAYYVVVDARSGALLWRKNISQDQTQPVTYNIYNNDSPTPSSPTACTTPVPCVLPPGITRSDVTVVSENASADNAGWIPDGSTSPLTTGNNVDAGLDRDGSNGIDAGSRPQATNRVFSFPYIPDGATDATGSATVSDANYRFGIITNIFFWTNRYHDQMYNYGFTEAARNFQTDNFGRGGLGNDFVRAEAQDSSGTNNANFSTPGDGSLPRMQMYIFTTTPNRDGDLDADVFIHEMTHGLSNRLHANATGLGSAESGGMGEGWSDFYARSLLSTAGEDVHGLYASGGYVTKNYYAGIRRFPYAVRANVGPNGKPHNPTTFADTDPALIDLSDGAFAPAFVGAADEVHNIGDIWCNILLEMRAKLVDTLGYAIGNTRSIQIVTDGMKGDPVNPTMVNARDSILAANCAGFAGANELDIWQAFALHGMGFQAGYRLSGDGRVHVSENFSGANLSLGTVVPSETAGNGNGTFDPGETVSLQVPLNNTLCSTTATAATATLSPGGGVGNYGNIAPGGNGSQAISYIIPTSAACGTAIPITITVDSTTFGPVTYNYNLPIGAPVAPTAYQNFDGVTAPALPTGWTNSHSGAGLGWTTSTTSPDAGANDLFTPNQPNEGTDSVTSPPIAITTGSGRLSFRNLYNLESGFDAETLQIKIGNGPFKDIIDAGGSFVSGGYNLNVGWTGLSGGTTAAPTYITTVVNLPATANGNFIQLRWTVHSDANTIAAGVAGARVDTILLSTTNGTCSTFGASTVNISGKVTTNGVIGLSGILMNLSGTTTTSTLTDGSGNYSFNGLVSGGNFTVMPATVGYDYTPVQQQYNNLAASVTNADFTAAQSPRITGRVTTPNGAVGIDGVTMTLSGSANSVQQTAGGGFYTFAPLTTGGNYTVTPSGAGNIYTPTSQTVNNLSGLNTVNFTAVQDLSAAPAAQPATVGQVLITEFRQSVGATNSSNEYVELYNNTDAPISVGGYGLAVFNTAFGGDVTLGFPPNVVIPRRGHIIVANTAAGGYSLAGYAAADLTHGNANLMPDNQGFGLVNASGTLIDSVGFVGNGGSRPYIEGQGIAPTSGARPNVEHAWVRKIDTATGLPIDTDNNANDFQLVSVTGAIFTPAIQSILGAPGPENAAKPVQGYGITQSAVDSGCSSGTPTSACTYARDTAAVPNGAFGTIQVRRKFTNNTGAPVTALRFRVIDDTTLASPGSGVGQADLRLLTSTAFTGNLSGGGTTPIDGVTLDTIPAQAIGGGFNSTVTSGTITVGAPLANGASINIGFLFGVQQVGNFHLVFVTEGLPIGGTQFSAAGVITNAVTASGVTLSGRVLTSDGRGLTNGSVLLTGPDGSTRTIVTGRNGAFSFDEVATGANYVLSVLSQRFRYSPKIIPVTDNVAGIDFVPDQTGTP